MKRKFKRWLIVILIICLIGTTVPVNSGALANELIPPPKLKTVGEVKEGTKPYILGEDKSKRDEYIKVFQMSDHTYQAAIYQFPVRYESNGQWEEIDNTLEQKATNAKEKNEDDWSNNKNNIKETFANNSLKDELVKLEYKDNWISWKLDDIAEKKLEKPKEKASSKKKLTSEEKKSAVENNFATVLYNDVRQNMDLKYQLLVNIVKEDIVLKDHNSQNIFSYRYNTSDLTVRQNNNVVEFCSPEKTDEVIFRMEAPLMYDSAGAESANIKLELSEDDQGSKILIKPDQNWLEDPSRLYPVTIDPTVTTHQGCEILKMHMYQKSIRTITLNKV